MGPAPLRLEQPSADQQMRALIEPFFVERGHHAVPNLSDTVAGASVAREARGDVMARAVRFALALLNVGVQAGHHPISSPTLEGPRTLAADSYTT